MRIVIGPHLLHEASWRSSASLRHAEPRSRGRGAGSPLEFERPAVEEEAMVAVKVDGAETEVVYSVSTTSPAQMSSLFSR